MTIARAIVIEPAVLLIDEPTGNLEIQRSREIMELLSRLNIDHSITVLMVTHEQDMTMYARCMRRSFLSILGIKNGISAVVTTVTLGSNLLMVRPRQC